jgi:hypothetical protein
MPPEVNAGEPFPYSIYVLAEDANGNVDPTFQGDVTVALTGFPQGGVLDGTGTVSAHNGVAVFSDLQVNVGGIGYVLQATSPALPGSASPATSFTAVGYTPAQVRAAYGFDNIPLQEMTTPLDGTGQTIALVAAFDAPILSLDLDRFDRRFGLIPSGPTLYQQFGAASSFLTVLNQNGHSLSTDPASPDFVPTDPAGPGNTGNWEQEVALDVEWAHAMAPGAHILLVEALSPSWDDLTAALATAVAQPGVSVVSLGWATFAEANPTAAQQQAFDALLAGTSGITFLAGSGDNGSPAFYPALSPEVVAVGGTSLILNSGGSYGGETGWRFSGGGFSGTGPRPLYQDGAVLSGNQRSVPDVAFVADWHRGVAVADSFDQPAATSYFQPIAAWVTNSDTSLAASCWAGLIALANQERVAAGLGALGSAGPTETLNALYGLPAHDFHDVTSGSNGGFSAGPGYDEVTGQGSPLANRVVPDLIDWKPIIFDVTTLPRGTEGVQYSQTITPTGGNGDKAVTYSILSGAIPDGLDFSTLPSTRLAITGSPRTAGTVTFNLTATDSLGLSTTRRYTLTVDPAIAPLAVTLSPASVPSGRAGVAYAQTITAGGGFGVKTVRYVVTAGAIPAGLSFTPSAGNPGQLVIGGTPTASGSATFQVTATDSLGTTATRSYTLTIAPPPQEPPLTGNVTALVKGALTPAPKSKKGKSKGVNETLTIRNMSEQLLQGPFFVVLGGLSPTVKVKGAAGFVGTKKKSPYLKIDVSGGTLQPGSSFSTTLVFSGKPNKVAISVFANTLPK